MASFLKLLTRWGPLAAFLAVMAGAWLGGVLDILSPANIQNHFATLKTHIETSPAMASLAYITVYAVCVAFALPVAAFLSLAGGALFGLWWGFSIKMVGAIIGATAVFWLARGSLGAWMSERYPHQINAVKSSLEGHLFTSLLVIRLIPAFPFFLVNIVPGLVGMKTREYVIATTLGIIPGGFVYTLAGVGLASAFADGREIALEGIFTPTMLAALIGLALLAILPKAYTAWKNRRTVNR